ncbi:APC family permease [Acidicapsa acidisoli]|uniref:APC family permease n=1 Tax=Acidicapsa acidisoli TaxID=1615681 RepID=UPI0021DFD349|nr:APC family permease [Acidicapsa acidisoli]
MTLSAVPSGSSSEAQSHSGGLSRRIGLSSAVALNMMDMIGVGPFLTLPLVIAAAGSRFAVWAWLLGAFIAVCDGLVCAELGAAFPRAGGSYAFLRQIYGEDGAGRWISFLYVWQLSFSAPLSIASGCIGLATFLAYIWPPLAAQPFAALPQLHGTNLVAAATCILVTSLLYRNLTSITRMAWVLFAGVLLTLAGVIVSGFVNGARHGLIDSGSVGVWPFSHLAAGPSGTLLSALAQATMITCYDYWGYYNICFLGSEVKRPEKTIPRAILISIAVVATLYVTMNLAVLPSLGAVSSAAAKASVQSRLSLVAEIAQSAFGRVAGQTLAALILWSAFASVFSLLLGYSRVPYAAARDGNYFSGLAAVHARHGFPHRSLIALGLVATCFCFFSLSQVITLLVVIRIVLQFLLQQAGVIWLRFKQPNLPRPFRIPLYPLPPLAAIAGFLFILAYRPNPLRELGAAAAIAASGTVIYMIRARGRGDWPFVSAGQSDTGKP